MLASPSGNETNPSPARLSTMSYAMSLSDREAGDIIRRIINLEEGVKDLRSEVKAMDGKGYFGLP